MGVVDSLFPISGVGSSSPPWLGTRRAHGRGDPRPATLVASPCPLCFEFFLWCPASGMEGESVDKIRYDKLRHDREVAVTDRNTRGIDDASRPATWWRAHRIISYCTVICRLVPEKRPRGADGVFCPCGQNKARKPITDSRIGGYSGMYT